MIDRPIAHDLDSTPDEPRLHSAWRGVRHRMATRRRARVAGLTAAAGVAVLLAATFALWPRPESGPLRRASGAPLHAIESIAEPRVLRLADESTIELAAGARIEPRQNDAQRIELELVRGRARFEVTPGGPREWTIDGGLARVHVVGTAFVVQRGESSLSVEVEHGRVRVEGPGLSDDLMLGAGERIEVEAPLRTPSDTPSDDAPSEPLVARTTAPVDQPREEPSAGLGNEDSAAGLGGQSTRAGDSTAPAEPGEGAGRAAAIRSDARTAPAAPDPAALLRAADRARREGRVADAVEPLETILRDHPDHPEASLAAITLARIQLGPLHDPTAALRSLRLARRLGVPRLFDAEVCASMALVLDATGDTGEARSEAQACLGRHGTPPHAEALRQLLDVR